MVSRIILLLVLFGLESALATDWQHIWNRVLEADNSNVITQAVLTENEIVAGLKEALATGVETSIKTLGRKDGFLADDLVRIALPDSLHSVEKFARMAGQDQLVDAFVTSLNRAAEQAVPEAANILGDAIRMMTLNDANAILHGADDAATEYFRRTSETRLAEKFLPIVQQATDSVGVTAAYKSLLNQAGGLFSGFAGQQELDLDRYVTAQTMDGLFTYIALQEQQIRENPAARSSELLRRVFSLPAD